MVLMLTDLASFSCLAMYFLLENLTIVLLLIHYLVLRLTNSSMI